MKMKEGRLEDPWKCVMNDCSNILCFPENSSRLINSWEEQRASLRFLTLSIPSSLDRLLSARNSAPFFLLFLWIKKERESEMAFCFIFLFYYFHFLVFIRFFSWRKAIHHDGGEQQQNPNSEGGGWFISPLCSTFFLSLSLPWFCRKEKEKKIRREKRMEEKKRDSLEALWN